jgi:hypothetical protein
MLDSQTRPELPEVLTPLSIVFSTWFSIFPCIIVCGSDWQSQRDTSTIWQVHLPPLQLVMVIQRGFGAVWRHGQQYTQKSRPSAGGGHAMYCSVRTCIYWLIGSFCTSSREQKDELWDNDASNSIHEPSATRKTQRKEWRVASATVKWIWRGRSCAVRIAMYFLLAYGERVDPKMISSSASWCAWKN